MVVGLSMAFLAGVLSTLSPCVLPVLPIVLSTAAAEHRLGPAAIKADRLRAAQIEHQLAAKFERWGALDARARAAS